MYYMQCILRLISRILVFGIIIILNSYCFVFNYHVDMTSTGQNLLLENGRASTTQEKDGINDLFCTFSYLTIRTLQ